MASYGDFAYYYDMLTENVDYDKRCEYICGLLAENGVSEGILLDLACGTGTMSLMFAEKGYDVVGVDGSEEMLTQAQEKKMESGADIIFLCQKMEELDLFGTINAAVSTLDSINHVTNEDTVKEILEQVDSVDAANAAMEACQKGMDTVGKLFEEGEYFVGDLIYAGELMTDAVEVLKPY